MIKLWHGSGMARGRLAWQYSNRTAWRWAVWQHGTLGHTGMLAH